MGKLVINRTKTLVVGAMVLVTVALYASTPVHAQDAPTTANLSPAHVQLVVNTDPKFLKQFSILAMEDLRKAGIHVIGFEDASADTPAKLLLTLKQEPLNSVCPGMVSYEASLALIEDVVLERTGEVIKDSTWEGTQPSFLRRQHVTGQDMERDLHELIGRFIINFKLGNPATSPPPSSPPDVERKKMGVDTENKRPIEKVPSRAPLRNLNLDLVHFSSRAGALGKALHDRALAMASKEGIGLKTVQGGNNLELSLNLDYGKSDEGCAGTDIYSARLALEELVRIQRPPGLYVWTTTWVRQITRVSAPPSKEQLEMDSDALLGQFIAAYKSDNAPSTSGKKKQ
ncbi:MAG: hypothetical protein EWM73_00212 [Nitrospira sp.]|nr:MAG: hypothetical protein EWM73_00212 [Nitrospira sp.]